MTQPVQEPLTQRAISSLTWGQNQLFRRPDPFSGGGVSWPWVVLENAGQTLPGDGAFRESLFTEVYWDPALTPDPTAAGGTDPFGVTVVDDGEGNDFWRLELRVEGWFTFEFVHEIDEPDTDGGVDIYFQQRISQSTGVPFIKDHQMGSVAPWPVDGAEIPVQTWIETYRTIWRGGSPQIYECLIRQNSTFDKSVGGHVKVWYLGGLGGGTDNADWEVASV